MSFKTVNLLFDNKTANITHSLHVARNSVDMIMEWYGSHHSGDMYFVLVDADEIAQDINGERLFDTIEASL